MEGNGAPVNGRINKWVTNWGYDSPRGVTWASTKITGVWPSL